jgi:2-polyprenyl-3-methyl-5-hydroxy-6-metoxy-1,4-benzoquinol methylase
MRVFFSSGLEQMSRTQICVAVLFFLDHSELPEMLAAATTNEKPWTLGMLPAGWEWFAFTFHNQEQIKLGSMELEDILSASDRATKLAYSRMILEADSQTWAKDQETEVDFIIQNCKIGAGDTVLDFGCGKGRHSLVLGARGIYATGIDYISAFIDDARHKANTMTGSLATFKTADCRTVELDHPFDAAICLYDTIGSYADDRENVAILVNLVRHVKPGGLLLISVMNMELTERIAQNWLSISSDPDRLLGLPASRIMEKTGDVFNPKFYMIDRDTRVVYRKEQFATGEDLFEEMIIRDRRYTEEQIRQYCAGVGLEVIWMRFVRTGKWNEPLERNSDKAKEILLLCRKATEEQLQGNLFGLPIQ